MSKGKSIFFLFLLALGLGNIFANYISEPPAQNRLFDSDALYLPTLFSDIFANNGQIKDWFLTPAPYFFPDFPMFFSVLLGRSDTLQPNNCFCINPGGFDIFCDLACRKSVCQS